MPNIIFSNRYLAERQFHDTSFSRKSFSRIVIFPNAIFSNRRVAEHHFPKNALSETNTSIHPKHDLGKMTFGQLIFRKIRQNDDSWKWRLAIRRFRKITFGRTTIRKNVVRHYNLSVIRQFGYVTIRLNYVRWCFFFRWQRFGNMTFRQNNDSVKWRFGKMMWPQVIHHWLSSLNTNEVCISRSIFLKICKFLLDRMSLGHTSLHRERARKRERERGS